MEVTRQITKHNYLVMDIADLPRVMKEVRSSLLCQLECLSEHDLHSLRLSVDDILLWRSDYLNTFTFSAGLLPGKVGAPGPGAGRCAEGHSAAAGDARLRAADGHRRLHLPPATGSSAGAGGRRHPGAPRGERLAVSSRSSQHHWKLLSGTHVCLRTGSASAPLKVLSGGSVSWCQAAMCAVRAIHA